MMKLKMQYKNSMKPLINLPTPHISFMWNFGSLLGVTLISQILTGLLLTMNYCPNSSLAFLSISLFSQDSNNGWLIRFMHSTGASMMMLFMYIHISRSLYYSNFKNTFTGLSGLLILIMTMLTAFLGYVLPWGQMSFWGATVITGLISAIPKWGKTITMWMWGGFSVSNPTLNRFFMLHFLFPFIILLLTLTHMMILHLKGSTNPLPFKSNIEVIQFHPKYSLKDLFPLIMIMMAFIMLSLMIPYFFMDPANFIIANPLVTPTHIQPEWYFLFSYAILRAIPNKMGGVIALLLSILIILITMTKSSSNFNNSFLPLKKLVFSLVVSAFLILTWIGKNTPSNPLIFLAQFYSLVYFLLFPLLSFSKMYSMQLH